MCYPKPAPRCSNHATAALTKAREAFAASPSLTTREALATAEADYFLTPAGIKALRKDGRYEEAEMNAERREAAIAAHNAKSGGINEHDAVIAAAREQYARASHAVQTFEADAFMLHYNTMLPEEIINDIGGVGDFLGHHEEDVKDFSVSIEREGNDIQFICSIDYYERGGYEKHVRFHADELHHHFDSGWLEHGFHGDEHKARRGTYDPANAAHGQEYEHEQYVAAKDKHRTLSWEETAAREALERALYRKARDSTTSSEELDDLADEEGRHVAAAVAANPNVSDDTLRRLQFSADLQDALSSNNALRFPPEQIRRFVAVGSEGLATSVAGSPQAPADVLAKLASSDDELVRFIVARNDSTPVGVAVELMSDPDEDVRERAQANIVSRSSDAREWLGKHHPEMAGLPLDWALGLLKKK